MTLKEDIHNQVWVWVDDFNDDVHLSPHFDYEDDALLWKQRQENESLQHK